jgi:hypothetical protein
MDKRISFGVPVTLKVQMDLIRQEEGTVIRGNAASIFETHAKIMK